MIKGVAVLSALPGSLDEVRAGAVERSKDYIRTQLLVRLHTPESAWDIMKPTLQDAAIELFDWCRANGVTVYQRAGLPELRSTLATSDLVIVLAHWKGPNVHWMDLSENVDELVQIAAKLGAADTGHAGISATTLRKSLKSAANEMVETWLDWMDLTHLGGGDIVVGDYYGRCLAREQLDATLGDLIVPGARLELSDGLWSSQEVAACFPDQWNGICDFFCCRSLYLSDIVKTKTRQGLIRADTRFLNPKKVFETLNHNLRAVASGTSYLAAAHAFDEN